MTMRLLLASLFLAAASAQCSISNLYLVKAGSGEELLTLSDGDEIDVRQHGRQISVRAEGNGCQFVKFDMDGLVQRVESDAPGAFYGAGVSEDGSEIYAANTISKVGPHTLTVCPNKNGMAFNNPPKRQAEEEDMSNCKVINFNTVDGSSAATNVFNSAAAKKKSRDPEAPVSYIYGKVNGDLMRWHKVTIAFSGPPASETGMTIPGTYRPPSVFADYRLDVTFKHESGKSYVVPGYFAGNGDPGKDGSIAGSVWLCHFTPDDIGFYEWEAKFVQGTNVAQNGGGNPGGFFDSSGGKFKIEESDKTAPDLRAKGRLLATDKNYLQFANGEYFLKAGPDSPQNLLAYDDFDGTPNNGLYRKSWAPHEDDYDYENDPTFAGGVGTGLIGAINYLAGKGMNAMSATLMNIDGDDTNVYPFILPDHHLAYDISKLAQWAVVFDHAESKGISLRLKLQDASSDFVLEHEERKLFYREMIARFGHHLGVVWDLGEDLPADKVKERSEFFKTTDPYNSPIAVRAWDQSIAEAYAEISTIDAVSLHSDYANVNELTKTWVVNSKLAGSPLAVSSDEQGDHSTGVKPDSEDEEHDQVRQEVLWGNLMAGGAGVQYFFGMSYDENDLTLQNFRSRDALWDQSRYALNFFAANNIPFQDMQSDNSLVSTGNLCLYGGSQYVVYKKAGTGAPTVDLDGSATATYTCDWYNPRTGQQTNQGTVTAGKAVTLGPSPDNDDKDWAILCSCTNC